jgi:hypothetical protein
MPNTNAPFGFRQYRGLGSAPTYEQSVRLVSSANTTAIFFGDPVTNLNTGYIARATAGTNPISGIFAGCKYLSTSQKRTVWSNFWPGADATGDVEAYVIDDPNAQFIVQAGGTAIGLADMGLYVQFNISSAGNTATGMSTVFVESPAATITLPFRIVGFDVDPPGSNGTDIASAFNYVIVAFNNVTSRSNTAGPTGI